MNKRTRVTSTIAIVVGGGAEMSFCIGPLEMVIWVVFDQKMVSIIFLCAKTPPYGGFENWPA